MRERVGDAGPRGRAAQELRSAIAAALSKARADGSELGAAAEAAVRDWARRYCPVHVSVQFLGLVGGDDRPEGGRLLGRMRVRFEVVPVVGETTISVDGADVG